MRGNRSNDSIFERVLSDLICTTQFSKAYLNQEARPFTGAGFLFLRSEISNTRSTLPRQGTLVLCSTLRAPPINDANSDTFPTIKYSYF